MSRLDGSEHVLVVPEATLDRLGRWRGFRPLPRDEVGETLDTLLGPSIFLPRTEDLEHGDRGLQWRQLVCYGVLCRRGSAFAFRRPAKGGDSRLRRKCSVGLGGHVNPVDSATGGLNGPGPGCLANCMVRELREEVAVAGLSIHLAGLLNDESNDVGRRHLGVVFRCELGSDRVRAERAEVEPIGWLSARELAESPVAPAGEPPWETWSALIVARIGEVLGAAAAAARA